MEKRADAATRRGDLPGFLQTLPSRSRAEAARAGARVQEQELRQWGLTGINLRSYQLEGVNWLAQRFHCQNGCILGDEMGLGKTCQTIALFIYLAGRLNDEGPFLILCPLSVLSNWKEEIERFAPGLSCVTYTGDKEERASLQPDLKQKPCFHVLLTTYEISLKDAAFLRSFLLWNDTVLGVIRNTRKLPLECSCCGFIKHLSCNNSAKDIKRLTEYQSSQTRDCRKENMMGHKKKGDKSM